MSEAYSLPNGELEIMQIVWQCEPPVSRSVIEEALNRQKHLAPSTILTFLTRLCDRGFLRMERHGRRNLYTPLITRKEYLAGESRRLLDRRYDLGKADLGRISRGAARVCFSPGAEVGARGRSRCDVCE